MTPSPLLRRIARAGGSPILHLLDRRFERLERESARRADALEHTLVSRLGDFEQRLFVDVVTAGEFFANQERATDEIRRDVRELREHAGDAADPLVAAVPFIFQCLASLPDGARVAEVTGHRAGDQPPPSRLNLLLSAAGFEPSTVDRDGPAAEPVDALVEVSGTSGSNAEPGDLGHRLAWCRKQLRPGGTLISADAIASDGDAPFRATDWQVVATRWAWTDDGVRWNSSTIEPDRATWPSGRRGLRMLHTTATG